MPVGGGTQNIVKTVRTKEQKKACVYKFRCAAIFSQIFDSVIFSFGKIYIDPYVLGVRNIRETFFLR